MPTTPGYAAISLQMFHTGLSRAAYLTFGVDPSSSDPQAVATSVATAINAASSLKSILDSSVTITGIRVSLGSDGTSDLVGVGTVSIAGGRSLTSLPPNVAVLVHKVTARGGRRGRGRLFIPWCVSTANVDEAGIIASAEATVIQTACSNFLSALSANSVPMYLLHDTGISAPGAPDLVTAMNVDTLISTQRRRLGRR